AIAAVDDSGCFFANDLPRPTTALLVLSIDDADTAVDNFARAGVLAPVNTGENTKGIVLSYIEQTTLTNWQGQVGALTGGCTSLYSCGAWVGRYRDRNQVDVGNVKPQLASGTPPANSVFCFRGDRQPLEHLDTTDEHTCTCMVPP